MGRTRSRATFARPVALRRARPPRRVLLRCGPRRWCSRGRVARLLRSSQTPPWDTWVALVDDGPKAHPDFRVYLIAWVPAELIACATAGISVNEERCIAWLDESNTRVRS